MPKRPSNWTPNQSSSTSRLAWLAAAPELRKRSSPWWAVALRIATGMRRSGTRMVTDMVSEERNERMADYAFPVDTVAGRLSKDEEVALRESGTLPDWFFDAVEAERKAERKAERRSLR